ncbi:hypothetical protein HY745_12595, partial [Candidatus Desantisbacteria bacterium]|nr:hypothetical protein [Candidatus Desantisbacteria bacterium]
SNNYIYNIEIEPVDKTNDKTNDKRTYRYIITKRDMNNIVINRFRLCGGETSFRLLGVDKNDSVYIIQDYLKFNKFKIIITKYDASGNLTAKFHLNEEYCQKGMEGTVYNVVDIDNEGLIFQMVNKENGLMVLKWEAVK